MPENRVPRTAIEIVEALFDFVQGPEEDVKAMPIGKVLNELKRRNLDPDPLVALVHERLAAARAEETLRVAKAARERIAQLIANRPVEKEKGTDWKKRLMDILASSPALAPVYRKFEEAPEADLESLLEDLNLLENLKNNDV
jgi:hypothetical protein